MLMHGVGLVGDCLSSSRGSRSYGTVTCRLLPPSMTALRLLPNTLAVLLLPVCIFARLLLPNTLAWFMFPPIARAMLKLPTTLATLLSPEPAGIELPLLSQAVPVGPRWQRERAGWFRFKVHSSSLSFAGGVCWAVGKFC